MTNGFLNLFVKYYYFKVLIIVRVQIISMCSLQIVSIIFQPTINVAFYKTKNFENII